MSLGQLSSEKKENIAQVFANSLIWSVNKYSMNTDFHLGAGNTDKDKTEKAATTLK